MTLASKDRRQTAQQRKGNGRGGWEGESTSVGSTNDVEKTTISTGRMEDATRLCETLVETTENMLKLSVVHDAAYSVAFDIKIKIPKAAAAEAEAPLAPIQRENS